MSGGSDRASDRSSSRAGDGPSSDVEDLNDDALTSTSPPDSEFISDAFQSQQIDEEALKNEMRQLGVDKAAASGKDDMADWERELQAELQEYEVVTDSAGAEDDDDVNLDELDDKLEQEILQEIEAEASK